MQNRLNNLIERGKEINARRLDIKNTGTNFSTFYKIEKTLNLSIPDDLKEISRLFDYCIFNVFQFFDTTVDGSDGNGIIRNNLELRKEFSKYSDGKSDMSHILVLSDDDGGSVFMITQDSPEKPTPIIWCDAGDMYHYSINGVFPHPHDEWPSFTDFFEYLVEKEEEKLKEDQK